MKIDIDLKDRGKLTALRDELQHALSVVEFALMKLPQQPSAALPLFVESGSFTVKTAATDSRRSRSFGETVAEFVLSIPKEQFTSTELYEGIEKEHGISRGAVKNWLNDAVGSKLRIVHKGMGRSPTVYAKI